MKRVIIIGCPGSGKSTLSIQLAKITGLPLCHLDNVFWNADKTTISKEEFAEKFGYDLLARIPMDPKLSALVDKGWIEMMNNDYMDVAAEILVNRSQKKI